MSIAPTPTPTPTPTPDWIKNILILVTAIVAAYQTGNKPSPVPVAPPAPIAVPPAPAPTPDVTPPSPSTSVITVSSSDGTTLLGGVDANTLFVVKVTTGYAVTCTVLPATTYGQIFAVSDAENVCVLEPGGQLQVIAYGANKPAVKLMVTANQAAQPPPVVSPPPPPPVPVAIPPTPLPSAVPLTLVTVYDKINSQTAETLQSLSAINALRAKGNVWKPLTASAASSDPTGQAAVAAASAAGLSMPYFVILTPSNMVVKAMPLPAAKDLLSVVQSFGG